MHNTANDSRSARFTNTSEHSQPVVKGIVKHERREDVQETLTQHDDGLFEGGTGGIVPPGIVPKDMKPYGNGTDKATQAMAKALGIHTAPYFLKAGLEAMEARAKLRDQPGGERSMERTVAIFNAWTDNKMSIEDGWRFVIALKQAREIQGSFHDDDYCDIASYAALLGEQASKT